MRMRGFCRLSGQTDVAFILPLEHYSTWSCTTCIMHPPLWSTMYIQLRAFWGTTCIQVRSFCSTSRIQLRPFWTTTCIVHPPLWTTTYIQLRTFGSTAYIHLRTCRSTTCIQVRWLWGPQYFQVRTFTSERASYFVVVRNCQRASYFQLLELLCSDVTKLHGVLELSSTFWSSGLVG